MHRSLAVAALSIALGLASAGPAQAAEAPRPDSASKAPQAKQVPKKAKRHGKRAKRPRRTSRMAFFSIGQNNAYKLLGHGTGCTSPSLQSGGWWYRWCGQDWRYPNQVTNELLEYQHQYYASGGWNAYLSTWCKPYGQCVYLAPDVDQAYRFFYQ